MKEKIKSIFIGLLIILAAIGCFIVSVYLESNEVVKTIALYSVHGVIENVFFSLLVIMALMSIGVLKIFVQPDRPVEYSAIVLSVAVLISFALFGAYTISVLTPVGAVYANVMMARSNGT